MPLAGGGWVAGGQHVAVATVAIPATECVVVRSDMHQDELDHEHQLHAMATEAHVLVNSTHVPVGSVPLCGVEVPSGDHPQRVKAPSGEDSRPVEVSSDEDQSGIGMQSTDSCQILSPKCSVVLTADEARHVTSMLRLNEHEDTQNYHLDDDEDVLTLQAFQAHRLTTFPVVWPTQ